jgi:hypothetical protein
MADFKAEFDNLLSDTIEIKVNTIRLKNILIPNTDGDFIVRAIFKKMTCEDFWKIEKKCSVEDEVSSPCLNTEKKSILKSIDYQEFRLEIIRRMLQKISIFDLEYTEEGLKDSSFEKVKNLSAPLVQALFREYEVSYHLTEEEDETITKQSAILFSPHSRGVENACETISLYCTLGNFWEKFGLNRFSLKQLPYKEYLQLRIMMNKDAESQKRKSNKKSNSSIGGRVRSGRGIVIPDTGKL